MRIEMKQILFVLVLIALAFLFSYTCSAQVFPAVVSGSTAVGQCDTVYVVGFDTLTNGWGSSLQWSATVPATTTYAIVFLNSHPGGAAISWDSVDWGGPNMTLVDTSANVGMFSLASPGTGSKTITAYANGSENLGGIIVYLCGVTGARTESTNSGEGTAATIDATGCTAGDWVVAGLAHQQTTTSVENSSGQVLIARASAVLVTHTSRKKATGSTTSFAWTVGTSGQWKAIALPLYK